MKAKVIDSDKFVHYQGIEFNVISSRAYTKSNGEQSVLYRLDAEHPAIAVQSKDGSIFWHTCRDLFLDEDQIEKFE